MKKFKGVTDITHSHGTTSFHFGDDQVVECTDFGSVFIKVYHNEGGCGYDCVAITQDMLNLIKDWSIQPDEHSDMFLDARNGVVDELNKRGMERSAERRKKRDFEKAWAQHNAEAKQ